MRLVSLRALGATKVRSERGLLEAILQNDSQPVEFEGQAVIVRGPYLEARTSDVERLGLQRGDALTVEAAEFLTVDFRPDGQGLTIITLEDA